MATEEKSNEITAIPELLKLVDIGGSLITIDAMGTQTAIATEKRRVIFAISSEALGWGLDVSQKPSAATGALKMLAIGVWT